MIIWSRSYSFNFVQHKNDKNDFHNENFQICVKTLTSVTEAFELNIVFSVQKV